jgi:hypothetical protein
MMPDQPPARDPGHLDVDAVSAYVDRDFGSIELAAIELHLAHCPACQREVLEIRTTVLLLSGLPQYAPRRSFRLGQEHARAARRHPRAATSPAWQPAALSPGHASTSTITPEPSRHTGWLSTMQVAAMVVGALLLLVTVGDLQGIVPQAPSPMQLAAPTAAAELPQAAIAPAPQAAPTATLMPVLAAAVSEDQEERQAEPAVDGAAPPAPAAFETAFQQPPSGSGGTERANSASEEMPADAEPARPAARVVATRAVAAVTQAIPTPGAANAPAGTGDSSTASATQSTGAQPSRLRIVQLALALLLAWLIVSIAGLRWVRRTG